MNRPNPTAWTVSTSPDRLGVALALGSLTLTEDLGPREAERLAAALLAAAERVRHARLCYLANNVFGREAVAGALADQLTPAEIAARLAPYEFTPEG